MCRHGVNTQWVYSYLLKTPLLNFSGHMGKKCLYKKLTSPGQKEGVLRGQYEGAPFGAGLSPVPRNFRQAMQKFAAPPRTQSHGAQVAESWDRQQLGACMLRFMGPPCARHALVRLYFCVFSFWCFGCFLVVFGLCLGCLVVV